MQTVSPKERRELTSAAKAAQKLSVPRATRPPNLSKARNIFLIRSAAPELFKKCVRSLRERAPRATLHIVSHERDRELIASVCGKKHKLYAYTAGGNYSVASCAEIIKEVAKANEKANAKTKVDTFVMLANNVYGYPHIAEILCALGAQTLYLFNINERWYTSTRAELEFKNTAAGVYLGICKLLWNQQEKKPKANTKFTKKKRKAA